MTTRQDNTRWSRRLGAMFLVASLSVVAVGLPAGPAHAAPAALPREPWAVVGPSSTGACVIFRTSIPGTTCAMAGPNIFMVNFKGVTCIPQGSYVATLGLPKGPVNPLPPGEIAVDTGGPTTVEVATFDSLGNPVPQFFHLEVNC